MSSCWDQGEIFENWVKICTRSGKWEKTKKSRKNLAEIRLKCSHKTYHETCECFMCGVWFVAWLCKSHKFDLNSCKKENLILDKYYFWNGNILSISQYALKTSGGFREGAQGARPPFSKSLNNFQTTNRNLIILNVRFSLILGQLYILKYQKYFTFRERSPLTPFTITFHMFSHYNYVHIW